MSKLELTTCREGAKISNGNWGYVALGAVAIKEHLSTSGRVTALGAQTEVTFRPGIVYKAYTGLKALFQKLDIRASAEAWKAGGLEVLRVNIALPEREEEGQAGPTALSGEIEVFFRVSAEFAFARKSPLFELWNPEGATVEPGERAPSAGVAYRTDGERRIVPKAPAQPAATPEAPGGDPDAAAAKAARDWINSPDEQGHVVASESSPQARETVSANVSGIQVPDAGADQRIDDAAISTHDASQTAGDNAQAAALHQYQANPAGSVYQPKELETVPAPPAPPAPPQAQAQPPAAAPGGTEVPSVDLSKVL